MQDEVNTKVVAIAIKGGKITAEVLKKALAKFIEEIEKAEKQASQPKTYRGKQSIKHLVEQNAAISNIEVTDGNIKSFERTANKYGIDYALKKDTSDQPPRYLVFFKGRDVDVMTQAFKEFSAKTVKQKEKQSLKQKLSRSREAYGLRWRQIRFHGPTLRAVVVQGVPSGIQNSVISLANVIVQANINSFGAQAMAGCGAYSKVEGFAFLPVTCFALALSTFISQNIGAEKYDRVKAGMKFGLICSPVLAECIGILFYIFAPYLIGAFNSNPDVIAFGVQQARTLSLFYCLLSYSHCCAGILRGFGRPIIPMIIMLADWCLFRITYITIAVRIIPNIQVVFWAYPITWTISTILFTLYLRKIRFPVTSEKERNFAN